MSGVKIDIKFWGVTGPICFVLATVTTRSIIYMFSRLHPQMLWNELSKLTLVSDSRIINFTPMWNDMKRSHPMLSFFGSDPGRLDLCRRKDPLRMGAVLLWRCAPRELRPPPNTTMQPWEFQGLGPGWQSLSLKTCFMENTCWSLESPKTIGCRKDFFMDTWGPRPGNSGKFSRKRV